MSHHPNDYRGSGSHHPPASSSNEHNQHNLHHHTQQHPNTAMSHGGNMPPPPTLLAPQLSGGSHSSSSSTTSSHDLNGGAANKLPRSHGGHLPGQAPGPADLTRLSHSELIQRVRKLEADLLKLASDHNHMIREANHRIQVGRIVLLAIMERSGD